MKKKIHSLGIWLAVFVLLASAALPLDARAEENDDGTKYYLGSAVNAGRDTGYAEAEMISEGDPHFGWSLGEFFVTGYTRVTEDTSGDPVFLKTLGDTVTLWFRLDQDITCLNGNDALTINPDTDGYDAWFGVEKTDFGRGTLIIRHTDYQNHTGDPVIYTDYLAADAAAGADVKVELFEEGDYEVALNYQVRQASDSDLFGWDIFSVCNDYRIFFRFSVRNGNCMVYPFDTATGSELTNTAVTENGFSLDLAKSRYLDIDIRKEVLNEGADGLTEDVRFNAPASDGAQFTEEGIYTITVSNRYTGQQTEKKIYVGTNDLLKAYVTTGLDIPEIAHQLSAGASVAEDGSLIPAPETEPLPTETVPAPQTDGEPQGLPWYVIAALVVIVPVAIFFIVVELRKRDRYSRWYRK